MYEEKIIEWCARYGINLEQFMVLHLLVGKKLRTIKLYANIFPFRNGKFLTDDDKQDLINRGFLVPTDGGFMVGKAFLSIYVDQFTAGNEIWALYPGFVKSHKGVMYPLVSMSKQVFRISYWDAIGGSWEEHQEIIKDVQYAIDNGLINFGIQKFLESEYWTKFRQLRLGDVSSISSVSNMIEDDED